MANFSLKGNNGISSRKALLKPWNIHEVTFTSVEMDSFAGKSDPSKTYKVMRIRFDNKEGQYTETVFFPTSDKDTERREMEGQNGKYYMPSNYDTAMAIVAQVGATINPEGYKKLQEISDKFKSFDDVVKALIKITDPFKGKFTTKLKLIGRNMKDGSVTPVLPRIVAISHDGDAFISDNFLGDAVGFSPYEENKRKAFLNAKPTAMGDNPADEVENIVDNEAEEIDLDNLDL